MPEKDPTTWTLGAVAIGVVMAVFGGLVSYLSRLRRQHTKTFKVIDLAEEIAVSLLVGMMVYMSAMSLNWPAELCGAMAGGAGHMGVRLLSAIERAAIVRIKKWSEK